MFPPLLISSSILHFSLLCSRSSARSDNRKQSDRAANKIINRAALQFYQISSVLIIIKKRHKMLDATKEKHGKKLLPNSYTSSAGSLLLSDGFPDDSLGESVSDASWPSSVNPQEVSSSSFCFAPISTSDGMTLCTTSSPTLIPAAESSSNSLQSK